MFRYLIFLCVLLPMFSFSQSTPYILRGTLQVNTGETFPYKLVFSETNGIIKGYSYTFNEPDETKSVIVGALDRRRHTLNFHETEIVSSKGVITKAYMCLIDATLEHTAGPNGKTLAGVMNNAEKDKITCTSGTIVFNDEYEIDKLFASQEKFDTVISMKRREVRPPAPMVTPSIAAPIITDKVTANTAKIYDWYSDSMVIDLWDGGFEDGDQITLLFNGATQLAHYSLKKQKKHLRILLSSHGIDTITIVAENEGQAPPNTANLMLTDGSVQYSVLAYNHTGQKAEIRIKKVK